MEHTSTATALSIGCGLSANVDAGLAAEQAGEQAAAAVKRGEADLVLVFASGKHGQALEDISQIVRGALEPGTFVAVSAEGIVGGETEIERQPGVSVFAAALPGTSLHAFTYRELPHVKDGDAPGLAEAARVAGVRRDLRATLFFADPFSVPAAAAVSLLSRARTVADGLKRAPVIGGMASGAPKPAGNILVLNERVMRAGGVGVAIRGEIEVDALVSQGCRPIGRPLIVTASQRNVIKALAGRPAVEVLREIVSELDAEDRDLLPNGVFVGRVIDEYKARFGRGDFLIRGVLGVEQTSGSIAVGDLVRTGQTIQFHLRDHRTASEDLELLLAAQQLQAPPAGGLLFTCNGRGSRFFGDGNHDAGRIARALAPDADRTMPLSGFFAAGEIGPIGDTSFLHGHTASVALFRARRRVHGED